MFGKTHGTLFLNPEQVFAMTLFMYIVDYLSPYGNRKTAKETNEPGDEFSLYNSLWFATASMLQQGPDNTPKSPSGRLLASSFWFFVLLMISTYTANLAAFFTSKNHLVKRITRGRKGGWGGGGEEISIYWLYKDTSIKLNEILVYMKLIHRMNTLLIVT